jgi:DNA-directed RNA polymerase subunit RPC12/RpoP
MKPADTRPWLWLSSTTDDPSEQREYLEQALAADPTNGAARRGLVLLSDQLDRSRLMEQGEQIQPRAPAGPEEAEASQVYLCPNCGGRVKFSAEDHLLRCDSCGTELPVPEGARAEVTEQVLDFVLPTTRGHRWAEAQHRLLCERCGAENLLPVGQTAGECAYCGSRQLIESTESRELVDPNAIGPARLGEEQAVKRFKAWLGKDWFAPDDLKKLARASALRPAYYPFWTFDGTLQMEWTCEVNEGSHDNPHWVRRNGVEFEMFDDVLVPGMKALKAEDLTRVEPFPIKEAVEFTPEYLAGWTAMTYDLPLADASLKAREIVARKMRRQLHNRVELLSEKRNVSGNGVSWSGLTFKHMLLPLWVGSYTYRGKTYRVLVNGQTGKVGGEKPRDMVKVVAVALSGLMSLVVLLFLLAAAAVGAGWLVP